ncbi:MAG: ABC transporter substrate-binding protein [Burkholderiales bacterium]
MQPIIARAMKVIAAIVLVALAAWWASPASAAPVTWADPAKTLHIAFPVAETGFDPAPIQDYYSANVLRMIFDSLYVPDYLARPYRVAPNTADGMPQVSADGKVWTIHIRKGIYFADDPVFKGKKRELTAQDYVYAWKRVVDPKVRAPNAYYLAGKLVGLDDAIAKARSTGKFDYDAEIPGMRATDRYTLQLTLVEPDYTLMGYLQQVSLAAVAREVVEKYGDASTWVMDHPVGTGPYRLKSWRRGQKIELEANPGYREEYFPPAPDGADASTRALAASMKGKRLPQIGLIDISIIEESNPTLLAFDSGALDFVNAPSDLAPRVLDPEDRLLPQYAKQGVTLHTIVQNSLSYTYFSMDDPVVGGYTPERIALRRAVVMGFDTHDLVKVVWNGQARVATQIVPPDATGHIKGLDVHPAYDPATARALLDHFGYKDRDGDGFRELPDGKPFTLMMGSTPTSRDRDRDELWKKSMKAIGIRIDFIKQKWPDLLKMGRDGNQLQMWSVGWINNSGDGDAFVQLLYGPNAGQSNLGRFRNADYDKAYAASKRIPDGPERDKLYFRMAKILEAYTPVDLDVYRYENTLVRPWVGGYKKNVLFEHAWKYLDIDVARQKSGK